MALTVLFIIVLIVALVFQQTRTAWASGVNRAGAETTLRSVLGVMERDLVHAVDASQFAGTSSLVTPWNDIPPADHVSFITLDGTNRVPQVVTYTLSAANPPPGFDLTRTCQQLWFNASNGKWEALGSPSTPAYLNGNQPLCSSVLANAFKFHVISAPNAACPELPLRVEIEAHVQKKGSFVVISGYSLGRNRPNHAEDRVVASP